MWRTLQITWSILWRCLELVIVVYVLSQITDHNTSLIVGVLGLVYAAVRTAQLNLVAGLLQVADGI
jgi:hypothetical protein